MFITPQDIVIEESKTAFHHKMKGTQHNGYWSTLCINSETQRNANSVSRKSYKKGKKGQGGELLFTGKRGRAILNYGWWANHTKLVPMTSTVCIPPHWPFSWRPPLWFWDSWVPPNHLKTHCRLNQKFFAIGLDRPN